jgi:hypothetical protein
VIAAYERHYGSTTQREDAAAELGMDVVTFRAAVDDARRSGFDIEAAPRREHWGFLTSFDRSISVLAGRGRG